MSFTNYKVPRDALLGRYVNVDAAGKFTQQGDMKVFYAAMMLIRENVICSAGKIINLGVLSTLRYSHIRTQFKISKTHERPIIDYQAQRAKIYPLLAKSYAVHFTSQKISEIIANR
jgi:acyl-CoA oxidase